jgi:hypothetical protein
MDAVLVRSFKDCNSGRTHPILARLTAYSSNQLNTNSWDRAHGRLLGTESTIPNLNVAPWWLEKNIQ